MNQVYLLTIFGMLVSTAIGYGVNVLIQGRKTKGSARLIFYDPDLGRMSVKYVNPIENEVTLKVGEKERRYILDDKARIWMDKPTWILHPRHGWNFHGPSDANTVNAEDSLMALAIANPESYHLSTSRNRPRDSLAANIVEEGWTKHLPLMMTIGAVLLVVIIGMLAWVMSHMGKGA